MNEEEPCCLLYKQHYDIDHEYDCPKAVQAREVVRRRAVLGDTETARQMNREGL